MSFLGIQTITPRTGGFDQWSFAHASHHNSVTTTLNKTATPTGNTTNGSKLITSISSFSGIFVNMGITGSGIPINTIVTGIDNIANNMQISNAATATATGVTLTLAYQPLTFYILDPIDLSDQQQFLLNHQLSHNAINGALGTVGNDLEDVDFNNEAQVRAWLDLDFTEHQTWVQMTGVT